MVSFRQREAPNTHEHAFSGNVGAMFYFVRQCQQMVFLVLDQGVENVIT